MVEILSYIFYFAILVILGFMSIDDYNRAKEINSKVDVIYNLLTSDKRSGEDSAAEIKEG